MPRNEDWMSRKLREQTHNGWFFYSFEECGMPDVPDLHGVAPGGRSCWIELKVVPGSSCQIPFRAGQPRWLEEHAQAGGAVYVLVLDRRGEELWLLKGAKARTLARVKLAASLAVEGLIFRVPLGREDAWDLVTKWL